MPRKIPSAISFNIFPSFFFFIRFPCVKVRVGGRRLAWPKLEQYPSNRSLPKSSPPVDNPIPTLQTAQRGLSHPASSLADDYPTRSPKGKTPTAAAIHHGGARRRRAEGPVHHKRTKPHSNLQIAKHPKTPHGPRPPHNTPTTTDHARPQRGTTPIHSHTTTNTSRAVAGVCLVPRANYRVLRAQAFQVGRRIRDLRIRDPKSRPPAQALPHGANHSSRPNT
jgi:hypothetical protein